MKTSGHDGAIPDDAIMTELAGVRQPGLVARLPELLRIRQQGSE
jgi:hypothetical protein